MIKNNVLVLGLLLLSLNSALAGGPENAVVVINAESASSKLIANHYIAQRNIPASNVIYLSGIADEESTTLAVVREKIITPIIQTITARKLGNHIDYIIYSSGFPTMVDASEARQALLASGNTTANNRVASPWLSLTSATFFYQSVLANDAAYLRLNANTYMRIEGRTMLTNPFTGDDAASFRKALATNGTGADRFDASLDQLESLADRHPLQLAVLYWLARTYAWKGDVNKAIQWLKEAIATGWCYQSYTRSDPAFAEILDDDSFKATLALVPDIPFRFSPTLGFRSVYFWGPNGMINSTPDQGNRYMLSTMLAVNRNQGNSEKESLYYLSRSIAADGTMPQGTFYFSRTNDVRSKTRQPKFDDAIAELRLLGLAGEVYNSILPRNKNDIAGLMIGSGGFDWRESFSSRILPGAICDNLTSYGGNLKPDVAQTKLTEFLRNGAAGSSGTVVEPFAIQAKFPDPRIHVHYARGCTLAESFYQSVAGPFQLLIVGDALCRPWAVIPKVEVRGDLINKPELAGSVDVVLSSAGSPAPIRATELYVDDRLLRRIENQDKIEFNINTTTMPDGYHEFRFVPVANIPIASRGSTVVPCVVNNKNQLATLQVDSSTIDINDAITFTASAAGANSISLVHNGRVLETSDQNESRFTIAAFEFGRGPINVQAEADFNGVSVRSRPLQLNIEGSVSSTIPIIQAAPESKAK